MLALGDVEVVGCSSMSVSAGWIDRARRYSRVCTGEVGQSVGIWALVVLCLRLVPYPRVKAEGMRQSRKLRSSRKKVEGRRRRDDRDEPVSFVVAGIKSPVGPRRGPCFSTTSTGCAVTSKTAEDWRQYADRPCSKATKARNLAVHARNASRISECLRVCIRFSETLRIGLLFGTPEFTAATQAPIAAIALATRNRKHGQLDTDGGGFGLWGYGP
ncbi:hypothetical protein DFP72DRAFT_859695 [Ephemerocybe angulata]|uniref:Uncharacterized protein n=1 Tax=Ephemerocybe angulata TaxID=980116 RepID=A0A8H6HB93_9AGAR|nr:hypothetical protein DFP72DRAFT_859695 [Tulosesus angulatus]